MIRDKWKRFFDENATLHQILCVMAARSAIMRARRLARRADELLADMKGTT